MRDRRHHYSTHPTYSGTILVGEHFCNWLKPPLTITTPTLTLYWVLLKNRVVGPNDPPVKKTREHSAGKQLWPNRGRHNAFSLLGLGGKGCSCCVHSVDVDGVELPSPLLAEVQSNVCVIRDLV